MAAKAPPAQCSDPLPNFHEELVTGILVPPTSVHYTNSGKGYVQVTGQSGSNELVLPHPLCTHVHSPQQETSQSDHSPVRVVVHGNIIQVTQVDMATK